ncbi:hypothetical protein [Luteimonas panaciterrae]|uniref:hypothetical protein n=1 Tax=Luteimonas panaciterrae TaxID=363885 RepID=UPI001CF95119|nr:hypothetical protein [Luteimonas panaciterrae]
MGSQVAIILDNPPLDTDAWADEVFREAGFHPVSNDEISKAMAQDQTTLDALLQNAGHTLGPVDALAGYYRQALQRLHGDKARLGLYGTAWLSYLEHVDACVVDWSEVEKRATAPRVSEGDGNMFRSEAKRFIHERTNKFVAPGRLLELEPGTPHAERVAKTLEFLRGLNLG